MFQVPAQIVRDDGSLTKSSLSKNEERRNLKSQMSFGTIGILSCLGIFSSGFVLPSLFPQPAI